MTAPSIKEALEDLQHFSDTQLECKPKMQKAVATVISALATLQPSGERREAIARAVRSVLMDGLESNDPGNWLVPMDAEDIGDLCEHVADTILASGLVQDEAGIRRDAPLKIDSDEISALEEAISSMERTITLRSHHQAMWLRLGKDRLAAIRSARDGGEG